MDKNTRESIIHYLDNSPKKVTKFILPDKKAEYGANIKKHRDIKSISGDEELVRGYLITKLVNELGYKEENIELEKEYDIGRPKRNKPRIDVIVRDENDDAFLYIELKSPQDYEKNKDEVIEKQLFNLASQEQGQGKNVKYLVLYTVEVVGKDIKDKCILIDYEKFKSFDAWKEVRDFADELPKRYGKAQKEPYIKGGKKDLETNFRYDDLDGLRKNLHNVLWGGGGTNDNEIFASLSRLILAKIQDESEKKKGEKYDFQVLSFKDGESFESNDDLFKKINELYRRALKERLNIIDKNELNESFVIDKKKFSLNKLKYTVSELERFSFVDGKNRFDGKDILGDFFEGIIREGFKQTKGQFFTHINIVKFMLWGLQLDKLAIGKINNDLEIPYLVDPSAGSGTFLIEYMKFITEAVKRRFANQFNSARNVQAFIQNNFYPDDFENKWADKYIYGSEVDPDLGTSVKVNMVLHGDGSANIFVGSEKGDGLASFSKYTKFAGLNILNNTKDPDSSYPKETNEKFDVVVTNPPFSVTLDKDTARNLKNLFLFGDKKNSENLFVERWYQLLKPNGRFGVVLPESVFDTTENKYIRLFIYKYFKVKAVVSLPQLTFEPFTSTKTSLLFAQKKTRAEIAEWDKLWNEFVKTYSELRTSVQDYVKFFIKSEKLNEKWAEYVKNEIQNKKFKAIKNKILYFLKDYREEGDELMEIKELLEKYMDEIDELSKFDKDLLGTIISNYRENTWWVFGEVAKELNYKIFMAEVENIGYKRTKRGEKPMPNELYRVNDKSEVLIDDLPADLSAKALASVEALAKEGGVTKTALDYMRKIEWD